MRASRLVSILLLLQTRGRLTAQQLADILEVSVRTIYRDMDALTASGVPLFGEPGKDGGYQVLDGYRTKLTGLNADEAQTLFLTGLPTAAADLGLGDAVAAAGRKLTAALPPELRDRAARLQQRFHLDTPDWYRDTERVPHLTAVADAVWNQRLLRMRYRRYGEPDGAARTIAPYGLVLKAGQWYLVGDHRDGGDAARLRIYRVARILDITALPGHFDRPPDFDLAAYWRTQVADFDTRRYTFDAVVRLSPEALDRLPDVLEPAAVDAAQHSAAAPDPHGWRRVTIPMESVDRATRDLFELGPGTEVLSPPELRDHIIDILHAMSSAYDPTL